MLMRLAGLVYWFGLVVLVDYLCLLVGFDFRLVFCFDLLFGFGF